MTLNHIISSQKLVKIIQDNKNKDKLICGQLHKIFVKNNIKKMKKLIF